MKENKPNDHWSECEQVFFHYGVGYGVTKDLKSIPLGSEEDIKHYFETGELSNQLNDKQKEVLEEILSYRKEQGIGTTNIDGTGMERASNNGPTGSKSRAVKSITTRQRLPLRPTRTKSKSLPGR